MSQDLSREAQTSPQTRATGVRESPPSLPRPRGRTLRTLGKRGLRSVVELGQRVGVSILPRHFYSEVPDFRALRRDDGWRRPRSMQGVSGTDLVGQLQFVESFCTPDRIARLARGDIHTRACEENGGPGYGPIEADFLYAFIQQTRPPQVIQVGCGVATAVMLHAAEEAGQRIDLICVEPFPNSFLKQAAAEHRIQLIDKRAQDLDPQFYASLQDGGLLFVDSTHVVGPGSEVNLLIMDVLPRLRRNHLVHFHDIYFPYDYQRGLLKDELFFSNETALLLAFLAGNPRFTVRASLSMLHYGCPDQLRRLLPNYQPAGNAEGLEQSEGHFPSSTFLEVMMG